jgi:hypothetical protein
VLSGRINGDTAEIDAVQARGWMRSQIDAIDEERCLIDRNSGGVDLRLVVVGRGGLREHQNRKCNRASGLR